MPDRKHHTDKFKRCVEKVMAKGNEESSAYAICTTSLREAGEPIFEAAEAGSGEEMRMLQEAGYRTAEMHALHLLGATGDVRTEKIDGRDYLVVPVVALMEGVIHAVNADTPEFVPWSTIERMAASFEGKPVTLGHPVSGGKQCSASLPGISEAHGIGRIRNARAVRESKRLLMETLIDKQRAKQLHPEMYRRLLDGESEEVSVGAFVVTDDVAGEHDGKRYKATWLAGNGDHLAFLPGKRGACSLAMGCGTHRAAECVPHLVTAEGFEALGDADGSKLMSMMKDYDMTMDMMKKAMSMSPKDMAKKHGMSEAEARRMQLMMKASMKAAEAYAPVLAFSTLEKHSLDERMMKVQAAINERWNGPSGQNGVYPVSAYALQTFDDRVIVRVNDETFSVDYNVEDGEVKLGEAKRVKQAWVAAAKKGRYEDCPACKGSGNANGNPCEMCDGEGEIRAAALVALLGLRPCSDSAKDIYGQAMRTLDAPEGHPFYGNQHTGGVGGGGGSLAKSERGKKAEVAKTKEEHRDAMSYHSQRVKELQDNGVAAKAHEDALEANLKAYETGSKADSAKANIMSDRAHEIESKSRKTKKRYAGAPEGHPFYGNQHESKTDAERILDETRERIRFEGGAWVLYSSDGKLRLGRHNTRAEAEEQHLAIRKRLTVQA